MNIGIFSGSFNPIHIGHLILANYIAEFTEIDEVWLVVSPQNPFKQDQKLLPEEERYKMVQMAVKDFDKLRACDFEFSLPRPSYTISTLDEFQKAYPQHRFSLIIGADNWRVFDQWKDHNKIIEDYEIKVYPRLGYRITIPSKIKSKVEALESPIIEVSSTFIREGIAQEKNMKAFLPSEVADYIKDHSLYIK